MFIDYFSPQKERVDALQLAYGWSRRFIPIEAAAMDASRVLLFVVSKETRLLSSIALAALYIGCNMAPCVQFLTNNAEVNGDRVRAENPAHSSLILFIRLFFRHSFRLMSFGLGRQLSSSAIKDYMP